MMGKHFSKLVLAIVSESVGDNEVLVGGDNYRETLRFSTLVRESL